MAAKSCKICNWSGPKIEFVWKPRFVKKIEKPVAKTANRGDATAKFNYKWPVCGSSLAS